MDLVMLKILYIVTTSRSFNGTTLTAKGCVPCLVSNLLCYLMRRVVACMKRFKRGGTTKESIQNQACKKPWKIARGQFQNE